MNSVPAFPPLLSHSDITQPLGIALIALGQLFVLSSFWKLGLTGTYLGDYFGILMSEPVTSFPFNVLADPMYVGSSICFLGLSFYYNSLQGFVFTLAVYIVYQIAGYFEGQWHGNQIKSNQMLTAKQSSWQSRLNWHAEADSCASHSFFLQ